MRELESKIEKYLIDKTKKAGGIADKLVIQNRIGNPDRWCFFPSGFLLIVEVKQLGKKPSPMQIVRIKELQGMNQIVEVVDSREAIDAMFEKYSDRIFK